MTVVPKAIITAFYGIEPKRPIFNACSAGGRQQMMRAMALPR